MDEGNCDPENFVEMIDEESNDRLEELTSTCIRDEAGEWEDSCCDFSDQDGYCKPDHPCFGPIERMETATASDVGFYYKFDFDEDTGLPSGCQGFDNDDKWINGKFFEKPF